MKIDNNSSKTRLLVLDGSEGASGRRELEARLKGLLHLQEEGWRILMTQRPSTSVRWAQSVFDFVTLLVPRRLADEEIGDALEVIQKETAAVRPLWLIRLRVSLKVASTVFWISINAIRYAKGVFSKAKSGGRE